MAAGRGKNHKKTAKGKAKHTVPRIEIKDGNITNGAIRRLARRGGVKRMAAGVNPHIRDYVDQFLEKVVRDTLTFTEHARRTTISAMDVVYALKKNGRVLHGYGL